MPSQQQQQQLSPTVCEHAQLMGSAGNESGPRTQPQTPMAVTMTGSILLEAAQPGVQWIAARQKECKGNFKNLLLGRGNAERTFRDVLPGTKKEKE